MLFNENSHCPSVISLRATSETIATLKPCPFCAGVARLANTHTASYWVECSTCGAERHDPKIGNGDGMRAHRASAKRAIAAWNERA